MSARPKWTFALAALAVGCGWSDGKAAPSLTLSRWFSSSSPAPEPAPSSAPEPSATVVAPIAQELPPRVALDGATRPPVTVPPEAVPAYARIARAWVYERPDADS